MPYFITTYVRTIRRERIIFSSKKWMYLMVWIVRTYLRRPNEYCRVKKIFRLFHNIVGHNIIPPYTHVCTVRYLTCTVTVQTTIKVQQPPKNKKHTIVNSNYRTVPYGTWYGFVFFWEMKRNATSVNWWCFDNTVHIFIYSYGLEEMLSFFKLTFYENNINRCVLWE